MSDRFFPVQNSTLSADALAERVLKRYHLSGQAVCRFFRKGICDTYRIEAGGAEYYLKVYRFGRRMRRDVTEEVRLLNYLDRHGVSVARPVMRKDGLYVNHLAAPEGLRMTQKTVISKPMALWWRACISVPTTCVGHTGEITWT